MIPREGEGCGICGYPVTGSDLCGECEDFQGAAAAAQAAVALARKPDSCRQCGGPETELRRKTASNGTPMYGYQCLGCGAVAGFPMWIKREMVADPDRLPEWDESIRESFRGVQRAQRDEAHTKRRIEYSAYLKTPKWQSIRQRVMRRAQGVCEGCGTETAQEVHHLTYANVGDELLYQLVALCAHCHERAHQGGSM